jgi:hypothetical protein
MDATVDGIPLVQVGINAEDGEEGAGVGTADQRAQQRRPRHPRGVTHLVATSARPQEEAKEGGRSGRSCV